MLNCKRCGESKAYTEFFKESTSSRGYRYACKKCEANRFKEYASQPGIKERKAETKRRNNRKKSYNFPPELFDERFAEQGQVCAICKSPDAGGRGAFHADHDHQMMKPRGVLCHNCNVGLGNFQDNEEILTAAIEYVRKWNNALWR